jgi:hypothetical protein
LDIVYPFQPVGHIPAPGGDSASIVNIYPSYTLNGVAYSEVAEIYQVLGVSLSSVSSSYLFFVNKDVGILKMKIRDPVDSFNRVWELQRYKIVH